MQFACKCVYSFAYNKISEIPLHVRAIQDHSFLQLSFFSSSKPSASLTKHILQAAWWWAGHLHHGIGAPLVRGSSTDSKRMTFAYLTTHRFCLPAASSCVCRPAPFPRLIHNTHTHTHTYTQHTHTCIHTHTHTHNKHTHVPTCVLQWEMRTTKRCESVRCFAMTRRFVCVCVFMHVFMPVCFYACMYARVCVYIYIVCVCVYMHHAGRS